MGLDKVASSSECNLCRIGDQEDLTGRINFRDLAVLRRRWRTGELVQE